MAEVLPSWADGPARRAILDFVSRVSAPGGPDFVPEAERIAVFDNDGTLWSEYPAQTQVIFSQQRLAELADKDPSLRERMPFKAFLDHDLKAIHELGKQAVFEVAFAVHSGMTTGEFDAIARRWLGAARHPSLGRLFAACTYQPQLELLGYLRASRFRTFIVTGGGVDFVRAISERAYGIPPEQVIGSSVRTRFEMRDGKGVVVRLAELGTFDDREVKVQNIALHIGRRPILAFGNSDGDQAMLRYTRTGERPSLALLLHHDDARREFGYDREFRLSPLTETLDKAAEYGITLVSMKADWKTVFAS